MAAPPEHKPGLFLLIDASSRSSVPTPCRSCPNAWQYYFLWALWSGRKTRHSCFQPSTSLTCGFWTLLLCAGVLSETFPFITSNFSPSSLPFKGMHAVTVGLTNFTDLTGNMSHLPQPPPMGVDPAQLQQLMQLLGASKQQQPQQQPSAFAPPAAAAAAAGGPPKQTAIVECPKSMVGRVIGKGGETIKALQQYTGAMIQIDQSTDPTRVTIAGSPQSLQLAVSMVSDIVRGTFKGFAMLRQIAIATGLGPFAQPQPVNVQGYGFVPSSQVFSPDDPLAAGAGGAPPMLRSPPTGPLTPPITPLRASAANNLAGSLPPETIAALLAGQIPHMPQQQQQMAPPASMSQDAIIAHLLQQLAMHPQQAPAPPMMEPPRMGQAGLDQAAIQTLLAQAGLMGAGQQSVAAGNSPGMAHMLPATSAPSLPPSTSLMLSAQGTPAVIGSSRQNVFGSGSGSGGFGSGAHSAGSASPTHSLSNAPSLGAQLGTSPSSLGGTGSPVGGYTSLTSAANPQLARRPTSGESSPLGRYGAIGSGLGGRGEGGEVPRAESPSSIGAMLPPGPNPWDNLQ